VLRAFGFARLDSLRSQEIDPHSNKKGIVGNRWQAVADLLFTMQSWPQLVATVRNGSQVVERVLRPSPSPAASWIAPSTPPPAIKYSFAALTIASTRSRVMSPRTTEI
jgi:hypothetical protein